MFHSTTKSVYVIQNLYYKQAAEKKDDAEKFIRLGVYRRNEELHELPDITKAKHQSECMMHVQIYCLDFKLPHMINACEKNVTAI